MLQKLKFMETDRKWIVVRIDGKLAGISRDFDRLAEISARIAEAQKQKGQQTAISPYQEICATSVDFDQVWKLKQSTCWDDLMLFGTDFQKKVWKKLWELTHPGKGSKTAKLLSYSDFADLCKNRAGVRAVAHAVGLNPLPVLIPCHLIVPKEAIDRILDIQKKAESTIFKGEDLCHTSILKDNSIDFGEYALGKEMKRNLIAKEIGEGVNA